MAANTNPIFSKVADIQWGGPLLTANTAKDGASGTVQTVFTADATNGGRVDQLIAQPIGTNVATVCRIFVNNGSSNTVAANNTYLMDFNVPASTLSETSSMAATIVPLNLSLPPGYTIFVTIGTAVAAGIKFTALGGKY